MRRIALTVSTAILIGANLPISAQSQNWSITELFTNSDGQIQYIELSSASANQGGLSGISLISSSAQGEAEFNFDDDLNGDTAGASLLLATDDFANLTGLTPDFILPNGFIPLVSGSLDFAQGTDTVEYSAGQMPLNGEQAISGELQPIVPEPTNFAGLSAPLSVDPFTTFDASDSSINVPVLEAPGVGIGNVNFSVDLDTLEFTLRNDYFLYSGGITAGNAAAEFQNGTVLYIPALMFGNEIYEANLNILDDDPITFGNPEVLSVMPVLEPQPDPEPEPEPDSDQESLTRGISAYNALCQQCHGNNGQGVTAPNLVNSSFNTFDVLRNKIDATMPKNNPSACSDTDSSSCATDIANYVLNVLQDGS